ncbi:HAMP domain-containing sensor histidine kinase [Dactylosporangium sp. CA-139066]|uniref:HAMP domain-containing sensor histidine kinase n=1 Tax=Dactylosporangium sp. CA-139066 TaxID=3239930 RepID=UPI003D8A1792
MWSRLGLRTRMAASYVLVSAAAVLLVEAVVLALAVPRILAADRAAEQAREAVAAAAKQDNESKAGIAAVELAAEIGQGATVAASDEPGHTDEDLLALALKARQATKDPFREEPAALHRAAATTDGRVLAGAPAGAFPPGYRLPAAALHESAGTYDDGGTPGVWATAPITITERAGTQRRIGLVYVAYSTPPKVAPAAPAGTGGPEVVEHDRTEPEKPAAAGSDAGLEPLIAPAVLALVLLLPVGALFGLLSTGRLIRRIRRLAAGTAAMAGGDLDVRVPASGGDEVGRLEAAFNTMAARLAAAQDAQRVAAGAQARQAERGRIARELHDAISQDLFSASLLAGGLRKALPAGGELQRQAASMEDSLVRTMREMRAMLLELRPIALEDAGLAEAIGELCRAYETRLDVRIDATVAVAGLPDDPALEHAVLRMTQEALANAVRHGNPSAVELRVELEPPGADGERAVVVTVRDDGVGFDPAAVAERHGMGLRLMHERAAELGGTATVRSAPGEGTTVRVRLPIGV